MERWEGCLAKTREALAAHGYDAALTFRIEHVRYVCPYQPPYSMAASHRTAALITQDQLLILVPQIDRIGLTKLAAGRFSVDQLPINQDAWGPPLQVALDTLAPNGRIAVDGAPARLMPLIQGDFTHDSRPFEDARRIKTREEVAIMRRGLDIVGVGIAAAWDILRPGATELELAATAEYAARCAGAEALSFSTIVGTNGEILRRRFATEQPVCEGDFVFLDLGIVYQGYVAEFSRSTVVGDTVTPEQRAIHRTAYQANRAMMAAIRPGVLGSELDRTARTVILDSPLAPYCYRHVTGSGIGLMLQERPIVSDPFDGGVDEVIEAGMVLNVEPGVYHPEIGGLRAEDIVLVTDDGYELLTRLPYDERLI
ncbi:MAG: aminopeptidase P family protein [Thermomicrobiales bacterium]|nr:aminopeptidase P family protein [Thermomicrobiales bacterium]